MSPVALPDYAVLSALAATSRPVPTTQPPSLAKGVTLTTHQAGRILTKLEARDLVESSCAGWRLTHRGRVLWASKGERFAP
ncbi:hypothetical protein [Nocardia yunnanensis]|nr:hypothetical protein [Nocardia yunnanensis]